MKVNRSLIYKLILESLGDDDLSPESPYEKIIGQMYSGDIDYARSAMNMYEQLKDMDVFSRDEMAEIEERWEYVQFQDILKKDEPLITLQKMGYDFHKVFEDAFGVFPPKGQKFEYNAAHNWLEIKLGPVTLSIDVGKEGVLEPFIYAEVEVGTGLTDQMGFYPLWSATTDYLDPSGFMQVKHDIYSDIKEEYVDEELEDMVSVSKLPEILGAWPELNLSSTWPELSSVSEALVEKVDRHYLFKLINEALEESWIKKGTDKLSKMGKKKGSEISNYAKSYGSKFNLSESEEEDQNPIDLLKNKIENIIPQKNWELYVQFFDLIDTFDESGLIEKEEANALRERLWGAVWFLKVYSTENLDEVAELFLTHKNLPEDTKEDIHSSIYYYGGYFRDDEWTLKYVAKSLGLNLKIETIDPENLYEISGADGDTLEKFKERLIELGEEERFFEVYPETGGLMFGVLAQPYVNFEKKIEEIFGATPVGDPMMAGGSYLTVSMSESIDEPFDAPMVKGAKVTGDVMFEWNPDTEYGMEITLVPAKLGTTPQALLQDYYGIWVSTAQDGPNIGKLEIGIQNYEDEFADHKLVQNKNGTYGFTVDEMKNKIKEMAGIDLNKIGFGALEESQYYYDARDLDTDYGYQAVELGQQMGDEDDRDRAAQVDKYVSLKVNKELKKAIEEHTKELVKDLTNEAAQNAGLFDNDDEEYFEKTWNELEGLYTRALRRPIQAMKEFDGSQESIDKWIDTLKSVERILYKARDPGMYYLGELAPDNLIIGDAYNTGNKWDLDGWDHEWDKMSVKPETAVKEAEDFFRPAIMKTIMGIQTKKSGVNVPDMMGLSEDENVKKKLIDPQPTVLEEGWEDQWPSEFGALLRMIKGSINSKSDTFNEALVKIFYRMGSVNYIMPIKFVRATSYSIERWAGDSVKRHSNKITKYSKDIEDIKAAPTEDFSQDEKDKQIKDLLWRIDLELKILNQYRAFEKLAKDDFYFGRGRRKEVLKQSASILAANPNDKLPAMRYSNKVIKSITKQLNKWRDKNATFPRVMTDVDSVIQDLSRSIQSASDWAYEKTFEGDLAVLVQFIKSLRGNQEDLGNKLADLIKNSKDLPRHEFVQKISAFVDENRQNEFIDCKDTKEDVPCVFLRLDDGTYWHRTSVDYCEITQTKMSNCGAASDPTGMLYNLMSDEGGTTKYYITLEYSKSKNKVIQVLGKANTMPKEKYWPAITSFFEAMGNPLLDKNAFMHMYGDEDEGIQAREEVNKKIAEFVEGVGARMVPPPAIDSWDDMKKQIREGYYSNTIEDPVLGGGRVGNTFRTSIVYGYEDDGKVKLMLKVQIILQTVTNDMWEQWRLSSQTKEIQKITEYSKTNLLREAIYEAIPEKYVDPAREIHLKYSKSAEPTIRMNSNGAYIIRTSYSFETRTRPWNKARGEYLVENFDQLTEGVAGNLKRSALTVLFDIAPKRAALVYPEEAKRLADVEDIIRDMNLDEGKKKMKLDRNYLTSMILEVLSESEEKPPYYEMMLDFDNPENVLHGIYMFAASELGIFTNENEHTFDPPETTDDLLSRWYDDTEPYLGEDEYIFGVDTPDEALRLAKALREFYRTTDWEWERYIDADWNKFSDPPRPPVVSFRIPK